MIKVTKDQIDAILGDDWAKGDADRDVMIANAWLNQQIKRPVPDPLPEEIIQAAAEIAKEADAGTLYQAEERETLSESVAAGSVSASETYAEGSKAITAGENLALALIAPWIGNNGFTFLWRV